MLEHRIKYAKKLCREMGDNHGDFILDLISDLETVVKNCSISDIVEQSEQLKAEGRKEATEEIRHWLIDMDYEGLAESL